MSGADRQAVGNVLGGFDEDDEVRLARQMKALVVRVLCKDVTTARCLFAESLLETNQPSFALTVVLAGTRTRVDCRRHVS
jgi:hypothetical protein